MKLSIVIAVLDSHEIVRRQMLHLERIGLPQEVELIIVDDGSDPPLELPSWVRVLRTNDHRPWTWALARNAGARQASGAYLLMTDIDYILPREAIGDAVAFEGDRMAFRRELAVLDENGVMTQELDVLRQYGATEERLKKLRLPHHPNSFVMKKSLFFELGGYREDLVGRPYPQGEDSKFKEKWDEWRDAGRVTSSEHLPMIYMFPNGKYCGDVDSNPFGLFHRLTRRTKTNPFYRQQCLTSR